MIKMEKVDGYERRTYTGWDKVKREIEFSRLPEIAKALLAVLLTGATIGLIVKIAVIVYNAL